MGRFRFYLQYAARNLWRSRRWSAFAMLSVAAGVATVVALRSLGLAIEDSLTQNLQSANKGDITLERSGSITFGSVGSEDVFLPWQLEAMTDWAARNNAIIDTYTYTRLQVSNVDTTAGLLNFASVKFINPDEYPTTQDIRALVPKNVSLKDLFQGGLEAAISENLAEAQNLEVGDQVRITGTEEPFTVVGIIPVEAEAGLRDITAAFFGFVYLDRQYLSQLSLAESPNRISLLFPEGTSNTRISTAADEIFSLMTGNSGFVRVVSVPEMLAQNAAIADVIGRFIVIMGLGAMLIGGVGIINTMLVVVRRRTNEIAALKTFGLKGHQIASMFMTEALLLGILGSVIGAGTGALISKLTNNYGETFIQQSLQWRLYPEALAFGFVLGVIVTAVFGVLPVLTAVKVRPGIILRPNETHVPALGVVQSFLVMLFVVVCLGLISGHILGSLPETVLQEGFLIPLDVLPIPARYPIGIIGVAVTLTILGILVLLLAMLVWIISKIPALGWVDMRLALKNLGTRRLRTATTLLAISTGMFAISSITFYGASVREILQFTLEETFGGNIVVLSPTTFDSSGRIGTNAQILLDEKLDSLEGITYRTRLINYDAQIAQVDDLSLRNADMGVNREALMEEMSEASRSGDIERVHELSQMLGGLSAYVNVTVRDTDNPNMSSGDIIRGRDIGLEDRGRNIAVVSMDPRIAQWGVDVGSQIVLEFENREFTFEVVGLLSNETTMTAGPAGDIVLPPDVLPGVRSDFQINTIQVEEDAINDVALAISSMPFFFPLNVEFIDGVISRLIDQFSALPLLVGLLSLGAAAVIMANTVALATLERRRQIGILKAVGLKSKRVLSIMLLENVLVSMMGGFIGIGLSALGVMLLSWLGLDDFVLIPDDARPVAIALVIAAGVIGSTATLLSAGTAVRERVLNVLRYD